MSYNTGQEYDLPKSRKSSILKGWDYAVCAHSRLSPKRFPIQF
jgi:hypothetical protein